MARLHFTSRLASTALAATLLGAVAVPTMAQPAPTAASAEQGAAKGTRMERMRGATPEQRQQFFEQKSQALKQKLQLTPAQEPAWNELVQTMKSGPRPARPDRAELGKLTTPERIDRMRTLRAERAAEADRRGEAVKAFYATLTPAQQKTFDTEGARMYGPRGEHQGKHGKHRPAAAQ